MRIILSPTFLLLTQGNPDQLSQVLPAAALRPAIRPVAIHSASSEPPWYIQPQNEPHSPAEYNLGIGLPS